MRLLVYVLIYILEGIHMDNIHRSNVYIHLNIYNKIFVFNIFYLYTQHSTHTYLYNRLDSYYNVTLRTLVEYAYKAAYSLYTMYDIHACSFVI